MENICVRHRRGKFILDLIGLQTPRARIGVFLTAIFILGFLPTSYLKYLPVRSVYEYVFHFKFYSSGVLRSLSMILHGNFSQAWNLNKLAFIVLPIIAFLLARDFLKTVKVDRQI